PGAFPRRLARARPRDVRAPLRARPSPGLALLRDDKTPSLVAQKFLFFRTGRGVRPRPAPRFPGTRPPLRALPEYDATSSPLYTQNSRTSYYFSGGTMDAQAGPDAGRERWQRRFDQAAKRDADFSTLSGLEVDPVYGPPDGAVVPDFDRIGWPGEFPFTRGIHATGFRGKPWTIRQ